MLSTHERLRAYLEEHEAAFREVVHPPTRTSEESAAARGESLRVGGKALLLKTDEQFRLFVLPADCQLQSSAIRSQLGLRKTRFATAEELADLTGLVPGAVPPFGHPVLPFPLIADPKIQENDRIAFNAGELTVSFIMPLDEYIRVARPEFLEFALRTNA